MSRRARREAERLAETTGQQALPTGQQAHPHPVAGQHPLKQQDSPARDLYPASGQHPPDTDQQDYAAQDPRPSATGPHPLSTSPQHHAARAPYPTTTGPHPPSTSPQDHAARDPYTATGLHPLTTGSQNYAVRNPYPATGQHAVAQRPSATGHYEANGHHEVPGRYEGTGQHPLEATGQHPLETDSTTQATHPRNPTRRELRRRSSPESGAIAPTSDRRPLIENPSTESHRRAEAPRSRRELRERPVESVEPAEVRPSYLDDREEFVERHRELTNRLSGWDERPRSPETMSFRQPKVEEKSRKPVFAAVLVALLVLAGGVTYFVGFQGDDAPRSSVSSDLATERTSEEEPEEKAAAVPTTGAEKKVKVGVFRGTYPEEVAEFGDWLGRDVTYAVDYPNRDYWKDISDPIYMLEAWQDTDYQMVLGVAMLPARDRNASLAAGAAGEYDERFERLAENLVEYGQGDAIIRLAWEFNVSKGRWDLGAEDRDDFVTYWRNIVTKMRSVPGAENLKFDWNVNNGGETYDSTIFYPGDKFVDYIGVDVYDISWSEDSYPYPADCTGTCRREYQERAWEDIMGATFGLGFWSSFAQDKGKPLSLPEWGLWDRTETDGHGGLDNPYFVQQMYKFIDDPANNVAYQAYFDVNPPEKGTHQLAELPKAQERFLKLFGRG